MKSEVCNSVFTGLVAFTRCRLDGTFNLTSNLHNLVARRTVNLNRLCVWYSMYVLTLRVDFECRIWIT